MCLKSSSVYLKYVDDTDVIFGNKLKNYQLFNIIINAHKNLKFKTDTKTKMVVFV